MRYTLSFPISGAFIKEGAQADFDGQPVEQQVPNSVILSGQQLAKYKRELDFFFHDIDDVQQMQDNTGILAGLDQGWLCEKVQSVDLSVCVKDGRLMGVVTLFTRETLQDYENEFFGSHIEEMFKGEWHHRIQSKEIPVNGGCVKLKFEEPLDYFFEMERKYRLTERTHPKYPWLSQIQALDDVNDTVGAGDMGGFVESERNLSQSGGCWIYDQAICCGEARVEQEAKLFDGAVAREFALVMGDACMFDNAKAEGRCIIRSGEIRDNARAAGDAVISEHAIDGLSPLIGGNSQIYGEVRGWFVIKDIVLPGEKLDNPTADMFILENHRRDVLVRTKKMEPLESQAKEKQKSEMER